jgi:RNA polymerase sigma factor for flagellar operon FliA
MTEPTEPDEYEAFFHANLPLIEKLLGAIAHRYGLRGDDADEYLSWARARLWEDDYAVLRKWRRESKLSTYLAVVLTNLAHEFRIRRNGRWRASAAAVRLGHLAVLLEKLVYHHGMRLEEAGEWLRTRGETTLTNRALVALLDQLPQRTPPRRPDEAEPVIDELPAEGSSDDAVLAAEAGEERRATIRALHAAIGRLPAQEQVIIRMYFLEGQTLASVSRALGVEQKPLYRVKDAALRTLRGLLLEQGITPERMHRLLGGELSSVDDPDEGAGPDETGDADGPARRVPPPPGPVRDGIGGPAGGKSGGARLSNETWGSSQPTEPRAAAPQTPDSSGSAHHE